MQGFREKVVEETNPGYKADDYTKRQDCFGMKAKINLWIVLFFLTAVSPLHAEESVSWEQCASEAKRAHPDLYTALALLQQAEADKQVTGCLLYTSPSPRD